MKNTLLIYGQIGTEKTRRLREVPESLYLSTAHHTPIRYAYDKSYKSIKDLDAFEKMLLLIEKFREETEKNYKNIIIDSLTDIIDMVSSRAASQAADPKFSYREVSDACMSMLTRIFNLGNFNILCSALDDVQPEPEKSHLHFPKLGSLKQSAVLASKFQTVLYTYHTCEAVEEPLHTTCSGSNCWLAKNEMSPANHNTFDLLDYLTGE